MPESDLEQYKQYVLTRLSQIIPLLQEYAICDFSRSIEIPEKEDEFTELLVGLNLMIEDIQELVKKEADRSAELAFRVNEMMDAIQKAARGDFSIQIGLSGRNDNLDSLAIGLNMMIDDIRSGYQEIESTNRATLNIMEDLDRRSKELSALNEKLQQEITERKRIEMTLQKTLNDLESKNKELDDYVYMTSHDLKAPLVTIQGFADLLKRKHSQELSEGARHYVDTIITGANNLNVLVTDLLALSRAGRRKIKVGNIAIADVVRSCLQALRTMTDEKGAGISFSENLPKVTYDLTNLKEIFSNLLANAINYSKPTEKPNIEIGWKETKNENVLWVKDNGIGIEEKYWEKIFQPFERVARDKKGTGIGLSIVKKIVERHGGRIWVDSSPGKGSTFYFTIPKELMIHTESQDAGGSQLEYPK